jgi:deazaflavin-dependent oxidoreductase (nitroreductase family)
VIDGHVVDTRARRFNRVVMALLRLGVPLGPMRLLTVTGRRTGLPRTTPIATFRFQGSQYVMQGHPGAAWIENARAAGRGVLRRGWRRRRVTLTEVPVEERRAILRHAGGIAPAALKRRFQELGLIEGSDPESFAAAAPRMAVFRIEDA